MSSHKSSKKPLVLGVAGVVVVAGLGYLGYTNYLYVSTDNANVQAHTVMLSSKVPGVVLEVNVEENQRVKAGQILAKIDDRDYSNTLKQMESELGSLQARLEDAEKNYKRLADLQKKGAVSKQQYDTSEALFKELTSKHGSLLAQVDQARLNQSYTEIKAPSDGYIARKAVEVGMLASMGQPLLGFVEGRDRWVVANFKETELRDIAVGKKAEVTVDAVPGRTFEGTVESLSPSTGSTFTLLPPDNATGNFTKVVQRVPVRIKLNNLAESDVERLQAGLSALVSVKIR